MSTTTTTTLREAINIASITGVLKEKNLEKTTINTEKGKKDVIRGEVVISTGENEEHKIRIFANKETAQGKENPIYKGLVTVMETYLSEAEALKAGQTVEEATKVRVGNGKIGLNEYSTPTGEIKSFPTVSTNFLNRVDLAKGYTPEATFTIEMVIQSMKPEIKNEEETGRLIIEALVPIYKGEIIPLTFIVEDANAVDYINDNYEVGKTCKVWGEFRNTIDKKVKVEKGFGKAKETVITNVVHELIITGGNEDQYDEDDEKSYSKELIKAALAEREIHLDELRKKAQEDKKSGNKGFGSKSNDRPKKELNF